MDLHDPIAQVFVGKDIDLNNFILTAGPNKSQCTCNIAMDPYATVKFFHFMIQTILETLLQVWISSGKVKSKMGVIGEVKAYFGAMES